MRIFIVLTITVVCLTCKPLPEVESADYPFEYERSQIEWSAKSTLSYHSYGIDTLRKVPISTDIKLARKLKHQPIYEIASLRFVNQGQAHLLSSDQTLIGVLRYQEIAGYLHLWYPNNLDEQYFFQRIPQVAGIRRPFFFYWKQNSSLEEKQVYFRVQDRLDFAFSKVLEEHLQYNPFLESGDTLQIISGVLNYQKE